MTEPASPPDQRALAAQLMRLYVSLIEAEEPRGLALLREFRTVLARLYATLVEFPAQGPSMTTHTRGSAPDVAHVESELIGRLPTGLYWSALRPLTWDTVGDRGVRDLAEALVDVWSWVKPMVDVSEAAFLNGLEFDMSDICRPLLVGLTILQELVIDLDAYRREWET